MNNNKVQIKDVYLFNESLNETKMGESLLFLFEKVIDGKAEILVDGKGESIDSQERKDRIICHSDYETWESVIEHWDSFKYPYSR